MRDMELKKGSGLQSEIKVAPSIIRYSFEIPKLSRNSTPHLPVYLMEERQLKAEPSEIQTKEKESV